MTARSDRLAKIRWSVCISKFKRSLCVSFSRTDAGLCIYNLFAWSNFNFLLNSHWILLSTPSCVVLYSFCVIYSFDEVPRTLLSILAVFYNAVVWMVLTRPPTFKSSWPFNNPNYLLIRVFHWSLSDSKSLQVARSLLNILNNVVVWMVSIRPSTSKSSRPFSNPLVTVPNAPITIGIIVTCMFQSYCYPFILIIIIIMQRVSLLPRVFRSIPADFICTVKWIVTILVYVPPKLVQFFSFYF